MNKLNDSDTIPIFDLNFNKFDGEYKRTIVVFAFFGLVLMLLLIFFCYLFDFCRTFTKHERNTKQNSININGLPLLGHFLEGKVQPNIEQLEKSVDHDLVSTNEKNSTIETDKSTKVVEIPYIGKLQYSIDYDFDKKQLCVTILQAKDLPAKDKSGTSDPYVKIYLLPDKRAKFQTKILYKNLNPVFNESFYFSIPYNDIVRNTLVLSIYDHDRFKKHDKIGKISLPLSGVDFGKINKEWRNIECLDGKYNNDNLGDICFSLRYAPISENIRITIFEAKSLKKMDINGSSDPYVKMELFKNGKRIQKKKTTIKYKTLNPYYNETYTFENISEHDLKEELITLIITVIDYDTIGSSEPIGKVCLGKNRYGAESHHWNSMIESPRHSIAMWHKLKNPKENR